MAWTARSAACRRAPPQRLGGRPRRAGHGVLAPRRIRALEQQGTVRRAGEAPLGEGAEKPPGEGEVVRRQIAAGADEPLGGADLRGAILAQGPGEHRPVERRCGGWDCQEGQIPERQESTPNRISHRG